MRSNKIVLVLVVIGCFVGSGTLFAHHGRSGYDNEKTLNLKATITGFEWSNPHVQIHFDAPDEKGTMQHWTCEGQNPFTLSRNGWTKDEFKPGDEVSISFHPAKGANGVGLLVGAVTASGQKLTLGGLAGQ